MKKYHLRCGLDRRDRGRANHRHPGAPTLHSGTSDHNLSSIHFIHTHTHTPHTHTDSAHSSHFVPLPLTAPYNLNITLPKWDISGVNTLPILKLSIPLHLINFPPPPYLIPLPLPPPLVV
ncbi:hypothetical protein JAAARDRAFT_72778 [Jaapia argillacea MUCL 33604]|uniref:Uncharacterized protein n=1 Tax=Jaapia argillacea MUCL 33604 TaxID=933084 RepID=A0A067PNW0_9AGAM|nr:hypothetical protein JAAARDRAFT_72778 [Jaapia argillacea MUCL 33604]